MSFSTEWEQRYQENTHLSIWPWSDLVSLVMRHARPTSPAFRVLEVGCGAGANIPLFQKLGVDFCAVEGSATIVGRLHERFPELTDKIKVGDFTKELPFDGQFDLIFDRGSLTNDTAESISQALALIDAKLKPGATFIGVDWFSEQHSDAQGGNPGPDRWTRSGFTEGPLAHIGRVHFSDQPHLLDLLSHFELKYLEHKVLETRVPATGYRIATFNFVATKKA